MVKRRKKRVKSGRQATLSGYTKRKGKRKMPPRTKTGRFKKPKRKKAYRGTRKLTGPAQTKRGKSIDSKRRAKAPGRRTAKKSHNTYYENRRNRAD